MGHDDGGGSGGHRPITTDTRGTWAAALADGKVDGWAAGVRERYMALPVDGDNDARHLYLMLKVAVVAALVNGHAAIEWADWGLAEAFMGWQAAIMRVFDTGLARRVTQGEFNEVVTKEMAKRRARLLGQPATKSSKTAEVDGRPRHFVRWRVMANDGRWHRYGVDVEKAIDSLVRGGALCYLVEGPTDDEGVPTGETSVNKKWSRLAGV